MDSDPTEVSQGSSLMEPTKSFLAIRWVFPVEDGPLLHLDRERLTLGRGAGHNFNLDGREASKDHAEIRRDGPLYRITDTASTNGVFVNGARFKQAVLVPGQVVRLGKWVGVVVRTAADTEDPQPVFEVFAPGVAGGPVLRPVVGLAKQLAPSDLPVVICGETGTGKEGFVHAIHDWSGRKGDRLVAVDCSLLTPELADADLFGVERGAFTGAIPKPGLFRTAHGSTLFLDEIVHLPVAAQQKLLRVLPAKEVRPVGSSRDVPVDVRVLAATQVPLQGNFQEDLCQRLGWNQTTIYLPPLRERKEEIPFLFRYFLNLYFEGRHPDVHFRLIERLCLYDWPGNVRELEGLVLRMLVFQSDQQVLRRSHLPEYMRGGRGGASGSAPAQPATPPGASANIAAPSPNTPEAHRARRDRELALLLEALRRNGGNLARAAASIGISRQRAYRLQNGGGEDSADPRSGQKKEPSNV